MKTNDVILAAFPKSGITWLSFMLASARCYYNRLPIQPTWFNIDWLVTDLHKFHSFKDADIWSDGIGSFLKSHALPLESGKISNVIYLLRNPYDTLKSYYHFTRALEPSTNIEFFVHAQIGAWMQHVTEWLLKPKGRASQSLALVQYEHLQENPERELKRLLYSLGFQFPESGDYDQQGIVTACVKNCSIEKMRTRERFFTELNPIYRSFKLEFVRPGALVREVEEMERYREVIEERTRSVYGAARST